MHRNLDSSGLHLFLLGRYSEANKIFNFILSNQPNDIYALCNRAATNLKLELFRQCIKDCDSVLSLQKNNQRAHVEKGKALYALNKIDEAKQVWMEGSTMFGDVYMYEELQSLLNQTNRPLDTGQKIPDCNPKLHTDQMASSAIAARGLVQHGVGRTEIDEKIAFGYLQVNTGNLLKGIAIFNDLIKTDPKIIAAYLGRGTSLALQGQLQMAINDFTSAIEIQPTCVDAWKRRGQSRAANGLDNEALQDLTHALDLQKDADSFQQRGLVLYKMKNFNKALMDFKSAATTDPTNKFSWNHMGLCLNVTGYPLQAIEAYKKALEIDPNLKEALVNTAQAYKDYGDFPNAESFFTKALDKDPTYVHGYQMRGLARYAVGKHKDALSDLKRCLDIDPQHKECRLMSGVIKQGMGMFRSAIADYDISVNVHDDQTGWYHREVALFIQKKLDQPWGSVNLDIDLDPQFREGMCKRTHPAVISNNPDL
eukprot:TRINITY_DN98_c0_g2_i1.p1 TRINITY_DN98_c0_g2~~TRINITY_DN98_c0_g2_i1.p1  ORF type:complete len:481 (-),score=80.93 TRINITY_DN98_c0_g2_i1:1441-2883(-)